MPETREERDGVSEKVSKSESEWKEKLTPEQYRVLREQGTEPAFSGALWDSKTTGTYHCAACEQALFRSEKKFESQSGWPSFYQPIGEANVVTEPDRSRGMVRTEVTCARCGSHLGHVFEDGPPPTGLRYCMNSLAMTLDADDAD